MKPWLKALLIVAAVALLVAGGIFLYARLAGNKPVDVVPANYWTLSYVPNQADIYGIVVSDDSMALYKETDRNVLEMLVSEGDAVHVGDPLVRYDATLDSIKLEESQLEREKLYNTLQENYAEYKRWAREDYERTIPTYTPAPTSTPKTAANAQADVPGIVRLGVRIRHDLTSPSSGNGTSLDPLHYVVNDGDPIPAEFIASLKAKAKSDARTLFVQISAPKSDLFFTITPDGEMSFSATAEDPHPKSVNLNKPVSGSGTEQSPWIFSYASAFEVPATFLDKLALNAAANLRDVYVTLLADGFSVSLQFMPNGDLAMLLSIIEPTPTPSPTPTPTPSPTPSPTPQPSETPEPTPTPYYGGWGPSKAEREEYARQAAQTIRENELKYRQLLLDIEKLQLGGADGLVYSTIEGTVAKAVDPGSVSTGETFLEVRGGTGLHLVSIIGEMDLAEYPVGTELTGFSYESGSDVQVKITEIGSMPLSTNYSNGGNPNSSGYLARMDIIGDFTPHVGEYIDFSAYRPTSERTANYLHEAYIREIDGQDCVFLVKDDHLVKTPVLTGKRMDSYIELLNLTLTDEDYIAFPYDKNAKDGAPVNYPSEGGMRYW